MAGKRPPLFISYWKNLLAYSRRSISRRILAAILIISSILTTLITVFQLGYDYTQDVKVIQNSLDLVGEAYTKSIASSLWEFHRTQLQTDLEGILTIPGIRYAQISSPQSGILIETGAKPTRQVLNRTFPLKYQLSANREVDLGELIVVADLGVVLDRLYNRVLFIFFTQLLKTLIISFAIYFAIQRILTRHLMDISGYLKKFDLRFPTTPLSLKRKKHQTSSTSDRDELDTLVDSINQMSKNLNRTYDELSRLNLELESRVLEKTNLVVEQRQKLEYASKMKALGEMAGGVAHEINSPLATITLSADMILQAESTLPVDREVVRTAAQKIQKTAMKIANIIQGLRTFSRDGSRDSMVQTSLREILDETLILSRERLGHLNIDLRYSPPPDDPLINCRKVEIGQVLLNLLNNATDAASDCQEKWIEIRCQSTDSNVTVSVTDCGPGIAPELKKQIFQPFFTTKEIGKGTGLGLSISLGIIESHGGSLKIDESNPHTSFILSLPRIPVEKISHNTNLNL